MKQDMFSVFGFFISLVAIFVGTSLGVVIGHNAGVEQALERVCNQSDGKYDFCHATVVKKYKVSIPDPCMEKGLKNELSEEEWKNCFGTPVFGMSKRIKNENKFHSNFN